jgi:hypothetical protein
MTNLLKDNKGNAFRIETCKYCTDYKGQPKPILPEDMPSAIRMPDGSYKCEPCQIEEIQNRIVKVTPNSIRAKEIIRAKLEGTKGVRVQKNGCRSKKIGRESGRVDNGGAVARTVTTY